MSTHVVTVYFGRCEVCSKQSPNYATQTRAEQWETRHLNQKHKKAKVSAKDGFPWLS